MRTPLCWLLVACSLLLGLIFTRAAVAAPTHAPVYALTEENDGIVSRGDRHYTQGLLFTRTAVPSRDSLWGGLTKDLGTVAGWLGAGPVASRRYQWPIVGQSLFTPTNTETSLPQPTDRPYAGWLYLGAGLRQRSHNGRVDRFQLLLGVVGPWALGEQTQDGFHKVAGFNQANGWDNQLPNEPGLIASYQTTWDWSLLRLGGFESDLLPEVGVSLGNVLTYGDVGVTLRVGQGLAAGGLPQTITPGLSGSGRFDPGKLGRPFGWALYAGVQTRAVWRNLFLQGNSFRDSLSVEKRDFVTDEEVGLSLLLRAGVRIDLLYIHRSREFVAQNGDDRFGSITLSIPLD